MTDTETEDGFQAVLGAMPKIADAVNAFTSEEVQKRAFETLVAALGIAGSSAAVIKPVVTEQEQTGSGADTDAEVSSNGNRRPPARKRPAKKAYTVPKDLNFSPAGKTSLEEFVAEKKPSNNDERNLVACHYLSEVMGITDIDPAKVLAVYSAAEWTAPAIPDSALRGTASRTGWIDTTNQKAITVPWKGQNQISKMPAEKKAKA
ncbi:MAG TPA: hypothetical protein VNU19_16755 [Candidatus Acidoferrum sp.]|jgi:hypothetical protein|nr:hypothetical protein [Candidatus Acidoferrum sp.]